MEGIEMKVIHGDRASGKTAKLLEMSHRTGAYIVCPTSEWARQTFRRAKERGYKIPYPLSFREFIKKQYAEHEIKSFLFDNIELCLQDETNVPIEAVTITTEKAERMESVWGEMSNV